ncbi:MAG: PD40 domain-containing protein [Candidatus Kapabacteria bacterium]|nr:PD40 domain-containing protein [Candidatus Kapabacteria bacterium]
MKKNIIFICIAILILVFYNSQFAFSQFGKNKVQYEHFNWKYIQSEHFDVYYNEGSKYLGEFTAFQAEKALVKLQNDLNYSINQRIAIIVYNSHVQFQQTNIVSEYLPEGVGGVTELFKNRVVLPFDGNYESFRHVIAHELTHAVLNDMFYGGTFQTSLSTNSMFEIPIWMNEGLAEWESLGTLTTLTDMYMRDLTISQLLPELKDLDGYSAYRCGQTFYWYIAQNYGEDKISELINKLNSYRNVDMAFSSTFNMKLDQFSEKWVKDMKKMYLPDLKVFQDPDEFADHLTNHKKTHNYYYSSPAISPNGQKFAYISDKDGLFGLWIRDLDEKGTPKKLVTSLRQLDFEELNVVTPGISWDPKSEKIAISAKHGGENAIYIVNANTGKYNVLSWGLKSISSVAWSPDGKQIAFIATLPCQSDIFIYDLQSSTLTNLTNDVFSDMYLTWSDDSKTIYFISDRGDNLKTDISMNDFKMWNHKINSQDIYSLSIDKKVMKRLTFTPSYQKTSLAVNNKANKLLYVSDENGISNIYELDLENLTTKPKTNSLIGISQLSLSPDGSKLLFTGQVDGGYDIYLMRFPLEKNVEIPFLPLTEYRESEQQKEKVIAEMTKNITIKPDSVKVQDTLEGYGDFEINFERQLFATPNPDALKKTEARQLTTTSGEYITSDTNFVERNYKLKFSPDIILGNPGYNTFYGLEGTAQMMFSDVLGDNRVYFEAYLMTDVKNSSFLINYSYLPNLIDWSFTLYNSAAYMILSNYMLYRYRNFGISVDASLPFDLFRRFEFGLGWMDLSRNNVDYPTEPSIERMLFIPRIRYVFDNTLWGWFGPMMGARYYIEALASPKITSNAKSFYNVNLDFRYYQPIIENYLTFAIRGAAGGSFGPDPQKYFLGGTENWINAKFTGNYMPFDDPIDFGFMQFNMPMRGWAVGERYGTKFFLSNAELRFPLFTALLAGPIPVLFQGVMGSIFYDIGGVWTNSFKSTYKDLNGTPHPADLLMSAGIGVRTYLLGLPIKLDIAWSNMYRVWSKPQYMFSLGYDF